MSGRISLPVASTSGVSAALAAAAAGAPPARADDEPSGLRPLWHVAGSREKAFVDLQNDVTAKDVEIAHREGFRSVEHLKRYTTLGMATDQGKTSNVNGHVMMAALTGRTVTHTGTTVSRAPHVPVAIGALAGPHRGKHFKATRYGAGHDWALASGATMIEAGQWLRPQWFASARPATASCCARTAS
jgi:sarcosine oxidase subunit alpha